MGDMSLYLLQLKPNTSLGSPAYQAIPLHMVLQNSSKDTGQYLVPAPAISHDISHQPQLIVDSTIETNTSLSYIEGQEPINNQATPRHQLQQSKKESPPLNLPMIDPKNIFVESNTRTYNTNNANIFMGYKGEKKVQSYVHVSDRTVPPRAVAVLPPSLVIRRDSIYPRRPLHSCVRFGPVKGIMQKIFHGEAAELVLEAAVMKKPIFLLRKDTESVTYIDISDKDKSNWLSLLPLGDQNTANVWLYEEDDELYAITTQTLHPRTPLALGYSQEYALEHGLSVGIPVLNIYKVFSEMSTRSQQWWCYECHRAMATCTLLQRHIDSYHKETKVPSRRRYRCKHCLRTFSRIFTLRRHTKLNCTGNTEKLESVNYSEKENTSLNGTSNGINLSESILSQSVDENRLPSDESLQNYTNNLDFSTTLFDTDRMPNLDISSSSRSDTDFNSFSTSYKDDTGMNNTFGLNMEQNNTQNINIQGAAETGIKMVSCSHCKQIVAREKLRQHIRTCPANSLKCECGQIFHKKEKLTQHILSEHNDKTSPKAQNFPDTPYKCQECSFTFKRRGMLVNHLRRVHKNMSATVPLERSVKHYPCVACIKVYRTAAKRDRHVRKHHPGAELSRAAAIESGRRAAAPAACAACPREYASRAKLLQHVRAAHPLLAPPVKTKRKS